MGRRFEGSLRALAGTPLFYKILIANSLIVLLGATVGTMITAEFVRSRPAHSTLELVGLFAALGTVASVAVNALILRLALAPIRRLEAAAAAVQSGDPTARADASAFADRDFRRLVETFNGMLDRLRENRRRLRELASEATRAAEAERKRIAQDLHDDTAQRLAALKLQLKVLGDIDAPAERRALLDEIRNELTDTLTHVRLTAHALRPETLEDLGFGPALRLHARRLEEQHDTRISVEGPATEARLVPDVELALYRIVQEALSNAARHAAAEHVTVHWSFADGAILVEVADDGRGFDVERALARRDRLGLFGLMERASSHGGEVRIDSEPGHGTTIRVQLPQEVEVDA